MSLITCPPGSENNVTYGDRLQHPDGARPLGGLWLPHLHPAPCSGHWHPRGCVASRTRLHMAGINPGFGRLRDRHSPRDRRLLHPLVGQRPRHCGDPGGRDRRDRGRRLLYRGHESMGPLVPVVDRWRRSRCGSRGWRRRWASVCWCGEKPCGPHPPARPCWPMSSSCG